MKILVIKGSPHTKGSSNLLADQFILGAKEAGHEIVTFDAGHAKIAPCLACEACHKTGSGVCCLRYADLKERTDGNRDGRICYSCLLA